MRDFWDVHEFVRRGMSFEAALADAAVKEGGVDAESLLYVLSDVNWEPLRRAALQSGLEHFEAVESFFRDLIPSLAQDLLPRPEACPPDCPST